VGVQRYSFFYVQRLREKKKCQDASSATKLSKIFLFHTHFKLVIVIKHAAKVIKK
ncbi:hypothetical protein HMPREF0653_00954, partial [Prevotella disiens JCM 6334 = ATCC 29426]